MKNLIDCPAERAVYFLGGKWKIRILFSLLQSKKIRFGELKKGLKTITQQMLSKQLKELEGDGIINRKETALSAGQSIKFFMVCFCILV